MDFPKISIITPSYNQGEYLEDTILSIIGQGYPNLEYIVIDGGSTDRSVEVIKKHEKNIHYWVSEKDKGMYHAIQKGFEKSTGEIMAWINSDDMHHPKSLFTIADIFTKFPEVSWLQGCPTAFDEEGRTVFAEPSKKWSKYMYYSLEYRWIQQESSVWRRRLWEAAGGYVDADMKLAGDLDLWLRFFRHAKLHTTRALVGGFRYRKSDQASLERINEYIAEAEAAILKEVAGLSKAEQRRLIKIKRLKTLLAALKPLNKNAVFSRLIKPLYEFPDTIWFSRESHRFELRKI